MIKIAQQLVIVIYKQQFHAQLINFYDISCIFVKIQVCSCEIIFVIIFVYLRLKNYYCYQQQQIFYNQQKMEEKNVDAVFKIQNQYLQKGWDLINTEKGVVISKKQLQDLIKYVFKNSKQLPQLEINQEEIQISQIIESYLTQTQCQSKQTFTIEEALEIMNWSFEQGQQEEQIINQQSVKLQNQRQKNVQNIDKTNQLKIKDQDQRHQLQNHLQSDQYNHKQKYQPQILCLEPKQQVLPQQKIDPQIQLNQNIDIVQNQQNNQSHTLKQQNNTFWNESPQKYKQDKLKKNLNSLQNNHHHQISQKQKQSIIVKESPIQRAKISNKQNLKKESNKLMQKPKRVPLQVKFYSKYAKQDLNIVDKPKIKKLRKLKKIKIQQNISAIQKLKQIFQFYCLLNNQFMLKKSTFDQIQKDKNIMNLHKFMLFCKDFQILNFNKKNKQLQLKNQQIIGDPQLQQNQKNDDFPIKQIIDAEEQRKKVQKQQIQQRNNQKIKQHQLKLKLKKEQQNKSLIQQKQKKKFTNLLNKQTLFDLYRKTTKFSKEMTFQGFIQITSNILKLIENEKFQSQIKAVQKQETIQGIKKTQQNLTKMNILLDQITNLLNIQTIEKFFKKIKILKIKYKKIQKQQGSNCKQILSNNKKIVQINGKFKDNIEYHLNQYKENRQKIHQTLKDKYLLKYKDKSIKMPSLHSNNSSISKQKKQKLFSVHNVLKQAKTHLNQSMSNQFGNSRLKQQGQNKSFVLRKKAIANHNHHLILDAHNSQQYKANNIEKDLNNRNTKLGYKKLSQLELQNKDKTIRQMYNKSSNYKQAVSECISRIKHSLSEEQQKQKIQYLYSMGVTLEEDNMLQEYLQQQNKTYFKVKD